MEGTTVRIDKVALYDAKIRQLELLIKEQDAQIQTLKVSLKYEKELRLSLEKQLSEYENKKIRHRRTKKEMDELRAANNGVYSELKSNGIPKAKPAESIRSYDDFKKMQDYYLSKNKFRDYTLWTIGVCIGVRASDLCVLKWKNVITNEFEFRDKITMYEKKTSKLQNCKITECIKNALTVLLNSINWNVSLEDYIFPNNKGGHLTEQYIYLIIHRAAKAVELGYELGSHSMRKSFANIVLCVDSHELDMNSFTKIQGLLNHSDVKCTMRYLGTLNKMYDDARDSVSDFCLGKSNINTLEVMAFNRTEDILNKLNRIEELLSSE